VTAKRERRLLKMLHLHPHITFREWIKVGERGVRWLELSSNPMCDKCQFQWNFNSQGYGKEHWSLMSWNFFFHFSFIIHMCIQGLVHFSPLPPPPPLPPTLPPPALPTQYPAETILPLSLILL
jgi:hypothetical protein